MQQGPSEYASLTGRQPISADLLGQSDQGDNGTDSADREPVKLRIRRPASQSGYETGPSHADGGARIGTAGERQP
jgi:hypothetical protein